MQDREETDKNENWEIAGECSGAFDFKTGETQER